MGRNQHWLNINEMRAYPIDESATGRDIHNDELPDAFLADMRIVFPRELGLYPFVGAASSTPGAITVLIQSASTRENDAGEHTLLASLTVPRRSIQQNRIYNLKAIEPGVAGFVVFGSGVEQEFKLSFESAYQTGLCQRAFAAVRGMPVPNVRLHGLETGLNGIVDLLTEPPFELTKETRTIVGVEQDVLVLKLAEDSTGDEESVFLRYAGPCGRRPDSGTCLDPQPVLRIGSVPPDCDGQITIEFQGAIEARRNTSLRGAAVLDSAADLDRTCRPPYLPDIHGNFPGEYDPYAPDSQSESSS